MKINLVQDLWEKFIEFLSNYLSSTISNEGATRILVLTFILLSPTFVWLLHKTFKSRISWYRGLFDERQNIAGQWIQTINKNDIIYYTLIGVHWSKSHNEYIISGIALDSEGKDHSTFSSYYISPVLQEDRYVEILCRGHYTQTGQLSHSYAKFEFNTYFRDGVGHFVDFELESNERQRASPKIAFSMERISPTTVKILIGKRTIKSRGDRLELVKAYAHNAKISGIEPAIKPPRNTLVDDVVHASSD